MAPFPYTYLLEHLDRINPDKAKQLRLAWKLKCATMEASETISKTSPYRVENKSTIQFMN